MTMRTNADLAQIERNGKTHPLINDAIRAFLPDCVAIELNDDTETQILGVDRVAVLDNSDSVYFDDKIRGRLYPGDICLEWREEKDRRGRRVQNRGWTIRDGIEDYVLFLWHLPKAPYKNATVGIIPKKPLRELALADPDKLSRQRKWIHSKVERNHKTEVSYPLTSTLVDNGVPVYFYTWEGGADLREPPKPKEKSQKVPLWELWARNLEKNASQEEADAYRKTVARQLAKRGGDK